MKTYDEVEVLTAVKKLAEEAGGVRALARRLGVTPSYVSNVLNSKVRAGPSILEAIGLKRAVIRLTDAKA